MSRRLDLDFSGRPPLPSLAGMLLLLAGALLALLATEQVADALVAQARYDESLARLDASNPAAHPKPAAKGPADPRAAARGAARRQVAQALESPWADLLDAIEARPDGRVALLAVEPSAVKRTVRITAEARDAQAMLDHLSLLQQDGHLFEVALVSHQRQTQAPGAPWRYQIQGAW